MWINIIVDVLIMITVVGLAARKRRKTVSRLEGIAHMRSSIIGGLYMKDAKEFKVGDRVRVINSLEPIYMSVEVGKIGKVVDHRWSCGEEVRVSVDFKYCHQTCAPSQLQLVSTDLDTLQEGDVVIESDNGDDRVILGVCGKGYLLSVCESKEYAGGWYTAKELEDNGYKVKGVEDEEETPMTVEEVSKLVGKKVKIVEGGK